MKPKLEFPAVSDSLMEWKMALKDLMDHQKYSRMTPQEFFILFFHKWKKNRT